MAEWLRRWRLRDIKYTAHDLEVMDLNPCRVKLGMRSTSV